SGQRRGDFGRSPRQPPPLAIIAADPEEATRVPLSEAGFAEYEPPEIPGHQKTPQEAAGPPKTRLGGEGAGGRPQGGGAGGRAGPQGTGSGAEEPTERPHEADRPRYMDSAERRTEKDAAKSGSIEPDADLFFPRSDPEFSAHSSGSPSPRAAHASPSPLAEPA